MLLRDCGVYSPRIDSSNNLCFTIKIKSEDWNEATKTLFYNAYNEWKTLDLEVVGMAETDPDIMIKLRWNLGALMNEYCQKVKINIESEKQVLYKRNGVTTRLDLTREQLESEIDKYRSGLYYDNF